MTRLLVVGLLLVSGGLYGQVDTLPRIVEGQLDWGKYTAMAPKFQQKDLTVRIVRLNNMTRVYEYEGSAAWQDDWHFIDLNGDRYIDGLYSGQTKHHKGWHTYLSMGDTAFKFPIVLSAPGYVHSAQHDKKGIELILRDDPGEKEYLTDVAHYYYRYGSDTVLSKWQVRYVSSTEIPMMGTAPEQHKLKMPMQLRTSAREVTEPAIDYDQDGRPDAVGNVVAEFPAGARLSRYAVVRQGDLEWSFVLMADPPKEGSVLKAVKGKKVYYAGWMPSGAFLK